MNFFEIENLNAENLLVKRLYIRFLWNSDVIH